MTELENRFNYHKPSEEKVIKHENVRYDLLNLAKEWERVLPEGREKYLAMTKLEEAMFWANASIARY